jgi:hypothetical protein
MSRSLGWADQPAPAKPPRAPAKWRQLAGGIVGASNEVALSSRRAWPAERVGMEHFDELLQVVAERQRIPLGRLEASLQVLQRTARLEPRDRRLLGRVAWDARLVRRTSADLRDLALIGRGRTIPLLRRPATMEEICEAAVWGASGTRRTVRSHGHAPGEAGRGEWDSERLAQAIAYLLEHALECVGPRAPVHLSWRGGADLVSVRIRYMHPSPVGAAAGAPGCHGLGMRVLIAGGLIRAHGGWMARARSGKWRSFVLSVPRRPRERAGAKEVSEPLDAGSAVVDACDCEPFPAGQGAQGGSSWPVRFLVDCIR